MSGRAVAALALLLGGCEADPIHELIVDVKTDLVALNEFAAVRIQLLDRAVIEREVAGRDWVAGQRVAELEDLERGTFPLRVALLDDDGALVVERVTLVRITGRHAVTVVITRSCVDVICPGPGDGVMETTCSGGRCVDPSCSPETPERCEPECAADTECTAGVPCVDARCVEGACFALPDDARCGVDEICDAASGCRPATGGTTTTLGGGTSGTAMVLDMVMDAAGNVWLTGNYTGTFRLGGATFPVSSNPALYVIGLTPAGSVVWSEGRTASAQMEGRGIGTTGGRVYVTGLVAGSAAFDSRSVDTGALQQVLAMVFGDGGSELRVDTFGSGANAQGRGIGVEPGGGYAIAGLFGADIDFGRGPVGPVTSDSGFVATVDMAGTARWAAAQRADDLYSDDAAVDASGAAVVVGRFFGAADFGGMLFTSAQRDAFIAAYDATGAVAWVTAIGSAGNDFAYDVIRAADGDWIVAGSIGGPAMAGSTPIPSAGGGDDAFVGRWSPDGALRWVTPFGGAGNDSVRGMFEAADGTIFVAGSFGGSFDAGGTRLEIRGAEDAFVAWLDPAGNLVGGRAFGGPGIDGAAGVAYDEATATVIVAGAFDRAIEFPGGDMLTAEAEDVFVHTFVR